MRHNIKKISGNALAEEKGPSTSSKKKDKTKKYPGRAPISTELLLKHDKGEGVDLKKQTTTIKNKVIRQKLKTKEKAIRKAVEETARSELLLTEDYGGIVPEPYEVTTQYKQSQIVENVDITSATKCFNLNLEFGPYCMRYTRNGRHLVIGGRKGHVAAFDWVTKKLACEINVMESVHDVVWLHVETMFAVAQKQWVYIYDNQGIEIHCLKQMNSANRLEFLPYHFLLASGATDGTLAWLDVSVGKIISRYNAKLGRISVMTQNPSNAVLCVGNSKGVVSMWSPNSQEPLAKMLCHTQGIIACAVNPSGTYMATSCLDRTVKIWDVRQLAGPVQHCIVRSPAHQLSYSQRGLIGMGLGNIVEIYSNSGDDMKPYLRHKSNWTLADMQFCPYEDVLGITTTKGFSSLLIPGSAEANFDALETNPYQTKSQRREAEVKALLDKIQPELITLDPNIITEVDVPTFKDKIDAKTKLLYLKPRKVDFKPRRTKAKGKGGTAKVVKTRKILKELSRREAINALREADLIKDTKKAEAPSQDYGVLNRFLSKTKKNTASLHI